MGVQPAASPAVGLVSSRYAGGEEREELTGERGKAHISCSTSWRALGDDVDDLKGHHHFAGLINDLDKRGDRTAIGL